MIRMGRLDRGGIAHISEFTEHDLAGLSGQYRAIEATLRDAVEGRVGVSGPWLTSKAIREIVRMHTGKPVNPSAIVGCEHKIPGVGCRVVGGVSFYRFKA